MSEPEDAPDAGEPGVQPEPSDDESSLPDGAAKSSPLGQGRGSFTAATVLLSVVALVGGFAVGQRLWGAPAEATATPAAALAESGSGHDQWFAQPTASDEDLGFSVDIGNQARVGQAAPAIALKTPDGDPIDLADFRGRPVLVNFFATWCGPCRVEMPHIEAAWRAHKDADGLVVLGVDLQESATVVPPFLESLGLTFPVALDEAGTVADAYGVSILPTSFFVDRNGQIAHLKIGYYNTPEELAADLSSILGAAGDSGG